MIKMNITCGEENSFNRGKTEKMLVERWASAPCLSSHFSASSLALTLFLHLPFWSTTWAHLCTAALEHVGTDKPAVMKMNVPSWSPIEFHYEVYLSGAGCQTPGPVLLGSLRARCGETLAAANLAQQLCPDQVLGKKTAMTLLLSVTFFVLFLCRSLLLCSLPYRLVYSVLMFLSVSVALFFYLQPIIRLEGKEE